MDVPLPKPFLEYRTLGASALPVLTDEALFDATGVRIAFTSREGGVSMGAYTSLNTGINTDDDPASVARNHEIVAYAAGAAPDALIIPNQVHGTRIVVVDDAAGIARAREEAAQGADGIVVRTSGVMPLLNAGDCPLVILVAPSGAYAVVHAGWRGALAHIACAAMRELKRMGAAPDQVNAYIGPHIGSECYEVSEALALQFIEAFGHTVVPAHRHISLEAALRSDLEAAGMVERRIASAGVCTQCASERYFSYRATDGVCGRQCAVAFRGMGS